MRSESVLLVVSIGCAVTVVVAMIGCRSYVRNRAGDIEIPRYVEWFCSNRTATLQHRHQLRVLHTYQLESIPVFCRSPVLLHMHMRGGVHDLERPLLGRPLIHLTPRLPSHPSRSPYTLFAILIRQFFKSCRYGSANTSQLAGYISRLRRKASLATACL